MLNKNSPGLLKKGAAWHLRWLVRTRADIGLRPSGLIRSRTDIKLQPSELVRSSDLINPLGRRPISALVLTSHLKCQAILLILLCLAAPFFNSPGLFLFSIYITHAIITGMPSSVGYMHCGMHYYYARMILQ